MSKQKKKKRRNAKKRASAQKMTNQQPRGHPTERKKPFVQPDFKKTAPLLPPSEKQEPEPQLQKKRQWKKADVFNFVLSVLLTAALVIILILTQKSCNANDPVPPEETKIVIGGGDPIPEEQGKEKDFNSMHLPAYGSMTFQAGTKNQTAVLKNPGENTCLIRISLILADGTTIYTSELVKPGYYTKPITLVAPMERGIYRNVTLLYECFTDDENHTQLNGATSKLDITVK